MNSRLVAALAVGTSICAISAPVHAQASEFSIPAGSLSKALDLYARQSGRQVVYRSEDVRTATTQGVRGVMLPEAALRAILAGTGFTVRNDRSGAVAIVREGNGKAQAGADAPLTRPAPATGHASRGATTSRTARSRLSAALRSRHRVSHRSIARSDKCRNSRLPRGPAKWAMSREASAFRVANPIAICEASAPTGRWSC